MTSLQLPDFTNSEQICDDTNNNQGIVRLATVNGRKVVWKISQGYDFIVDHEARVMTALKPLQSCCPHYVHSHGTAVVDRTDIPIDVWFTTPPQNVPTTVLMMDYISDPDGTPSKSLDSVLRKRRNVSSQREYSLVMQLLNGIWFGQRQAQFTHYDLHSSNILVQKTPAANGGALYITDNSVSLTPVYGEIPVIIDYGFSYVSTHDHKPFYNTLEHAEKGYMPCIHHPWIDTRFLLAFRGGSRATSKWKKWLYMLPQRGFSRYYQGGWEEDVTFDCETVLGTWLTATIDVDLVEDEDTLELVADTLGSLGSFPFTQRQEPETDTAVSDVFLQLITLFKHYICCSEDSDMVSAVYSTVRAYINGESLKKVLRRVRRKINNLQSKPAVTDKTAKSVEKCLQVLRGYIEHFYYQIWQERQDAWDAKSSYINSSYRSFDSIAVEARKHAPEGIGKTLKKLGRVTVYDLTTHSTTVIDVPEFPESPPELTILYRDGQLTNRVLKMYRSGQLANRVMEMYHTSLAK